MLKKPNDANWDFIKHRNWKCLLKMHWKTETHYSGLKGTDLIPTTHVSPRTAKSDLKNYHAWYKSIQKRNYDYGKLIENTMWKNKNEEYIENIKIVFCLLLEHPLLVKILTYIFVSSPKSYFPNLRKIYSLLILDLFFMLCPEYIY